MILSTLSKEDLIWVAGLYEGEGCTSKQSGRTKNCYTVCIAMTDKDIIERVGSYFPFGKLGVKIDKRKPHYKPVYTWTLSKQEYVQAFLVMILPWLGERRKERALSTISTCCSD